LLNACPVVHQRKSLAALLDDFDTEGFYTKRMQAACDKQTRRVVPTVEVAAANNAKSHV
jgi:hypothetical protein